MSSVTKKLPATAPVEPAVALPKPARWSLLKLFALLGFLVACVVAARAYRAEAKVFAAQRHAVPSPEADPLLSSPELVKLRTRTGETIAGWYYPSRNGAAVVFAHGTSSDRRSLLDDARPLIAAGFGALLFDFPGHGESGGDISWDAPEQAAIRAAIDYVSQRSEVQPPRVGLWGFSMGAVFALELAARDPRVRALTLAGAPTDLAEITAWEYRRYGWLSIGAARLAQRVHGHRPDQHRPLDHIRALSPRPLLIIGGERDNTVPVSMARDLFAAARQPKELLLLPGAGHGAYRSAAPLKFTQVVVEFFERALINPPVR